MSKLWSAILIVTVSMIASSYRHFSPAKSVVNWRSVTSAKSDWNAHKKPILVDIFTDWCHYCKLMDATTYSNDSVISYMNDHFHSVRINAENQAELWWMGKTYHYIPKFKLNELAIYLTNGNIVYPTTVLIGINGEMKPVGGSLTVNELECLLKYFGENQGGKISWEEYSGHFKSQW